MRLNVFVIGLIAILSTPASAQVLSWQGVGSVRLGMTVAEAELALNAKLGPVALPYSEECYVTGRADGKDEALSYVIEDGRIVVMTVFLPDYRQPNPNIVDANGIGVGSSESDIRRGYKLVEKAPAPDFRESEEDRAEAAKERAKHGITEPGQKQPRSAPSMASLSLSLLGNTGSLRRVRITGERLYSRPGTKKCFT
jgi:hypothetical protein